MREIIKGRKDADKIKKIQVFIKSSRCSQYHEKVKIDTLFEAREGE